MKIKEMLNMQQKTKTRDVHDLKIIDKNRNPDMLQKTDSKEMHDLQITKDEWKLDVQQQTKAKEMHDMHLTVSVLHHIVCKKHYKKLKITVQMAESGTAKVGHISNGVLLFTITTLIDAEPEIVSMSLRYYYCVGKKWLNEPLGL